jgi:hypothetical protein
MFQSNQGAEDKHLIVIALDGLIKVDDSTTFEKYHRCLSAKTYSISPFEEIDPVSNIFTSPLYDD